MMGLGEFLFLLARLTPPQRVQRVSCGSESLAAEFFSPDSIASFSGTNEVCEK